MKVLGLTGGIGSGKTTLTREFKNLKVPVFIADEQSKKLLAQNEKVIKAVKKLIGKQAYKVIDENEVPDTKMIASKVFNDNELLKELNAILHPAVRESFDSWRSLQNYHYCVYEAAILFESDGESLCDETLLVAAPQDMRIQRVVKRDGVSIEEVMKRISNQWSQYDKLLKSNLVINNVNLKDSLYQVRIINEFMLNR
ncbi:MAG: dephospho-CoA kinase [Nonlabens sp.]